MDLLPGGSFGAKCFLAEAEVLSFLRDFRRWLHRGLSTWQLSVRPVTTFPFRYWSPTGTGCQYMLSLVSRHPCEQRWLGMNDRVPEWWRLGGHQDRMMIIIIPPVQRMIVVNWCTVLITSIRYLPSVSVWHTPYCLWRYHSLVMDHRCCVTPMEVYQIYFRGCRLASVPSFFYFFIFFAIPWINIFCDPLNQ